MEGAVARAMFGVAPSVSHGLSVRAIHLPHSLSRTGEEKSCASRYFGCGTIRKYGFGDFQPAG